jgi:hypothetical protein
VISRVRLLLLAAATALLLQLPFAAPDALAASDTEAQNPDLTVTLTVPDQVSIGDTIAATMEIVNNSPKIQFIAVKGIWTDPTGDTSVQSQNGLLLPGQTVNRVINYIVSDKCVPGTHQITLSVETRGGGSSSATAPVEVVG